MADLAYSYHNFIFPFIWQNSAENYKGPCFEEIKNNFENTHVWANDDLDDWYEIKLNEKEMLIAKSTTIRISASLGVSSSEETGDYDFEQLQSLADRRLYLAKQAGRNRVFASDNA